jgi:hypothetical protein
MIDMSNLEDELKYHNIYEDDQSGQWLDLSSSVINGRVVEIHYLRILFVTLNGLI